MADHTTTLSTGLSTGQSTGWWTVHCPRDSPQDSCQNYCPPHMSLIFSKCRGTWRIFSTCNATASQIQKSKLRRRSALLGRHRLHGRPQARRFTHPPQVCASTTNRPALSRSWLRILRPLVLERVRCCHSAQPATSPASMHECPRSLHIPLILYCACQLPRYGCCSGGRPSLHELAMNNTG